MHNYNEFALFENISLEPMKKQKRSLRLGIYNYYWWYFTILMQIRDNKVLIIAFLKSKYFKTNSIEQLKLGIKENHSICNTILAPIT